MHKNVAHYHDPPVLELVHGINARDPVLFMLEEQFAVAHHGISSLCRWPLDPLRCCFLCSLHVCPYRVPVLTPQPLQQGGYNTVVRVVELYDAGHLLQVQPSRRVLCRVPILVYSFGRRVHSA